MRGKWVLLSVSVILLAAAAGALSLLRRPALVPSPPASKQEELQTAAADEITLMGKLQAALILPIAAPVDGVLDSWDVQEGQEVLEGQLLGHINNSNLEALRQHAEQELERVENRISNLEGQILAARLEAARAEADAARAAAEADRLEKIWQRQQLLFREGATPRLTYEKAQREHQAAQDELATANALAESTAARVAKIEKDIALAKTTLEDRKADLERAQKDMEATNVIAPADGMILTLAVEPGGTVEKSRPDLVQLVLDPSILQFVAEPDPKQLARIRAGQPALIHVPEVSSEGILGEVREVKNAQVVIEFTSPNPAIRHGMSASARLKLP